MVQETWLSKNHLTLWFTLTTYNPHWKWTHHCFSFLQAPLFRQRPPGLRHAAGARGAMCYVQRSPGRRRRWRPVTMESHLQQWPMINAKGSSAGWFFLLQFLGCSILKELKYPEFCSPCHDLCVATWQPFLNLQKALTTWQWEFGFSLEANKLSTNLLAKKNESGSCLQAKPTPSAYQ